MRFHARSLHFTIYEISTFTRTINTAMSLILWFDDVSHVTVTANVTQRFQNKAPIKSIKCSADRSDMLRKNCVYFDGSLLMGAVCFFRTLQNSIRKSWRFRMDEIASVNKIIVWRNTRHEKLRKKFNFLWLDRFLDNYEVKMRDRSESFNFWKDGKNERLTVNAFFTMQLLWCILRNGN